MTTPTPQRRWYHLTPDRFFIGLLVVQLLLLLSERFQWFAFNEKKGWTVLIAVGVVGVAVLVMLIWGLGCVVLRRRFQFGFRSLLLFVVAVPERRRTERLPASAAPQCEREIGVVQNRGHGRSRLAHYAQQSDAIRASILQCRSVFNFSS